MFNGDFMEYMEYLYVTGQLDEEENQDEASEELDDEFDDEEL